MPVIAATELDVFRLTLGGNVFGWTTDQSAAFAVLDAYAAAGGNSIDTADVYPVWAPGCSGGESETIIGRWLASRGNRDQMVIATKVCAHPDFRGLSAGTIRAAAEASLRRLGTDRIDLYYAHYDDPATPVEETVSAFDGLVRSGKVRYLGASNVGQERLTESLAVARREDLARYVALQPHYNQLEREYELALAGIAARENLACLPYAALALGFLTGKYRPGSTVDSPRAPQASAYLDGRGVAVIELLAKIAAGYGVSSAAVALAWLSAQPTVVSVIASARTPGQLGELLPFMSLSLSPGEIGALSAAAGTGNR